MNRSFLSVPLRTAEAGAGRMKGMEEGVWPGVLSSELDIEPLMSQQV